MTTHNFNLTDKEKEVIELLVMSLKKDNFEPLNDMMQKNVLQTIYLNCEKGKKCLNCLRKMLRNKKLDIPNYTFFKTFQDDKKIQKLFTKKL